MASVVQKLIDKKLIKPPSFLYTNIQYEVIFGSVAYGVSSDTSDIDVQGFCIPNRNILFPHLAGVIPGFGNQGQSFEQYQQHHIQEVGSQKNYDLNILSIVKVFELARLGNPNVLDMLFVPQNCILHSTQVGNIVRENRRLFLSKVCWPRYRGYAYSQLHHLDNKKPVGKRLKTVEQFGYDVKFSYHIVRLLNFAEQILATEDLDIQQDRERLKAIRRGEWTEQQIRDHFSEKEKHLEELYRKSTLREACDEAKLKELLLNCLEIHYGNLDNVVVRQDESLTALRDIDAILDRLKGNKVL